MSGVRRKPTKYSNASQPNIASEEESKAAVTATGDNVPEIVPKSEEDSNHSAKVTRSLSVATYDPLSG